MKRTAPILFLLLVCCTLTGWGQESKPKFSFSMVPMDSTFDAAPPTEVSKLMAYYKPLMEKRMMTVVGYAPKEMRAAAPESPLSNFAADALLVVGAQCAKEPIDFSLINFGGLRASFPKGDVRLYDIYAVFPFENAMVILDVEGKDVLALFDSFAGRGRVEALANVKLTIEGGKVRQLLIAGKPFDIHKRYKIATIDFLLGGGDNVSALKNAVKVEETDMMVRDVILQYISTLKSQGKDIEAQVDGRVVIVKNN